MAQERASVRSVASTSSPFVFKSSQGRVSARSVAWVAVSESANLTGASDSDILIAGIWVDDSNSVSISCPS